MRTIKHIWRYLTSPTYRAYVDLMQAKMANDALMAQIKEQLRLSISPPLDITDIVETMNRCNLDADEAISLIKAEYGIKNL